MTTQQATAAPPAVLTPQCAVGRRNPGFKHGCPQCSAPGYQHPVLGWIAVLCDCEHHSPAATQ